MLGIGSEKFAKSSRRKKNNNIRFKIFVTIDKTVSLGSLKNRISCFEQFLISPAGVKHWFFIFVIIANTVQ